MKEQTHRTQTVLPAIIALGMALASSAGGGEPPKKGPGDFPLDAKPLDRSGAAGVTSYAAVVERATGSVVSIFTAQLIDERVTRNPQEEFLRRFFGIPLPGPQEEEEEEDGPGRGENGQRRLPAGVGSGVIVSPDGYILTNFHVVHDGRGRKVDEIKVQLPDRRQFTGQIVGGDEKTDLAVVKIEAKDLPVARMADSEGLRVGDICFAIGNPMGVGLTVTQGIISALRRSRLGILGDQGYENFIQTDASINPGNSGGALIDPEGRLIGINTAIISRTGGNMGIGFAIPTSIAREIALKLINTGKVQRGYLGVVIKDIDEDMREAFKLANTKGALVQSVQEGKAAARAGLKRGDVIVSVDGAPVQDLGDLRIRIADRAPGQKVALGVVRDGKEQKIEAVLDDLEAAGPMLGARGAAGGEFLKGVMVEPLNPGLRRQYSLGEDVAGLVVTEVSGQSPYADVLREGMVILEINDRPVSDVAKGDSLLKKGINKIYVYHRGSYEYLVLRVEE